MPTRRTENDAPAVHRKFFGARKPRLFVLSGIVACEEAFTKRTEWNEPDSEFLEGGQQFRFRTSPPQRIFALDSGDRLDSVCAADRLHSCFGKAEVFDLAFLNEVLHRFRHILDWHRRVNTMLVEEVNCLDSQSFE
jgi:hypothetical protein